MFREEFFYLIVILRGLAHRKMLSASSNYMSRLRLERDGLVKINQDITIALFRLQPFVFIIASTFLARSIWTLHGVLHIEKQNKL